MGNQLLKMRHRGSLLKLFLFAASRAMPGRTPHPVWSRPVDERAEVGGEARHLENRRHATLALAKIRPLYPSLRLGTGPRGDRPQ